MCFPGEDEACCCRPTPGVTQDIAGYKIAHQPSIYVLETPGVLVPSILDIETEPKLAFAVLNTQGTPLHWKHLNSRRLEGIQYDSKEKHEYNLKDLQPKRLQPKRTKPPNDSDMLYIELI
nr:short integuments 2, mitochondrial [Quercus suber]